MTAVGELQYCLGIQIIQSTDSIKLTQTKYVNDLCIRFGVPENVVCPHIPLDPNITLSKSMCPEINDPKLTTKFRELLGSLQYLASATRPDIAVAVSSLAQFNQNPGPAHLQLARKVLYYCKGTKNHGLVYSSCDDDLTGFTHIKYNGPTKQAALKIDKRSLCGLTDADFGGTADDRRSIGGYVVMMGGAAISWRVQRQPTHALSTLESEYMAMSRGAQEVIWLRRLLTSLGYLCDQPTTIYGDNQGCNSVASDAKFHDRIKHIDIRHHFIREQVQAGAIKVLYCSTKVQVADILTKPLPHDTFVLLRAGLGLLP